MMTHQSRERSKGGATLKKIETCVMPRQHVQLPTTRIFRMIYDQIHAYRISTSKLKEVKLEVSIEIKE